MNEIQTTVEEQLRQLQFLMHRSMLSRYGAKGNPHKGQGRILAILGLKPEMSQKELTFLLNMRKQSVAELIGKLEKQGFITREPSEEDRRVMNIKLTQKGKDASEEEPAQQDSEDILSCLSDEELAALSGYLGRIIARYEEMFPGEDFEQHRKAMEAFMAEHQHGRHRHGAGFGGPGPGHGHGGRGPGSGRGQGKHGHGHKHHGHPGNEQDCGREHYHSHGEEPLDDEQDHDYTKEKDITV